MWPIFRRIVAISPVPSASQRKFPESLFFGSFRLHFLLALLERKNEMNKVEEIRIAAELMELLDRKREEAGSPYLGSAIERSLLDAHLRSLENDILEDPGALESMLVRVNRRYKY
jgi:hypothetical protein